MLLITAPIADAPWYLMASGPLSVDSMPHVLAAIQAVRYGEVICPVLDLTTVDLIDAEAGNRLAEMVDRGDMNILGPGMSLASVPARLAAVVRESHLEAMETVLALIRRRRHDGIADHPAIAGLLDRLRTPDTP